MALLVGRKYTIFVFGCFKIEVSMKGEWLSFIQLPLFFILSKKHYGRKLLSKFPNHDKRIRTYARGRALKLFSYESLFPIFSIHVIDYFFQTTSRIS